MSEPRSASRAPWVVAAVAAVVFIALIVVYYVALSPARASANPGQLTATEQRAVSAASTETVNLLSYRRAHFTADFNRALAGTTGALHTELAQKRADTLSTITKAKIDLSGRVTHAALQGPADNGKGYVVLVTANGYQSSAPNTPRAENLQVTVVPSGGKFLASDVQMIGLS